MPALEAGRGTGVWESAREIIIKVPGKVSSPVQMWGAGGDEEVYGPTSPLPATLPRLAPAQASWQPRLLPSHEVPTASLTRQAIKSPNSEKATSEKGWGQRHRLVHFPGLPFSTTSFRSRHKGKCWFVGCLLRQHLTCCSHTSDRGRTWGGFSGSNSENVPQIHPFSCPTSKHKPVWLECYLPHVQFLLSRHPFWTGNLIFNNKKGNIPLPKNLRQQHKIKYFGH